MNSTQLFRTFSYAVNWNAFAYTVYKLLFTALSFLLYKQLTIDYFATWANINSMIYLLLLWLDFGFNKSISRFVPEFSRNTKILNRFVNNLIIFKLISLCAAIPFFLWSAPLLCSWLNLCTYPHYFWLGAVILISHGLTSTIKLIYHAHFWQKQFNILGTTLLIAEMTVNLVLLYTLRRPSFLITGILITKIISSILTSVIALIMLKNRYKNDMQKYDEIFNTTILLYQFKKHSFLMWLKTNVKSLTERNVIVPLLTYIFGPSSAAFFKVANDGALLFYRSVMKTIGTTDTTLLTYAQMHTNNRALFSRAFKKLMHKIVLLCIIAISFLLLIILFVNNTLEQPEVFYLVLFLTTCYLIESLLSPYERVLEVKYRYWLLALSMLPYGILFSVLLLSNIFFTISLFGAIIIIHAARLLSSLTTVILTKSSLIKVKL